MNRDELTTLIDGVQASSCAHCMKSLMEEENPQYCDHCEQNVCHECWHKQYPTGYCLVCDTSE